METLVHDLKAFEEKAIKASWTTTEEQVLQIMETGLSESRMLTRQLATLRTRIGKSLDRLVVMKSSESNALAYFGQGLEALPWATRGHHVQKGEFRQASDKVQQHQQALRDWDAWLKSDATAILQSFRMRLRKEFGKKKSLYENCFATDGADLLDACGHYVEKFHNGTADGLDIKKDVREELASVNDVKAAFNQAELQDLKKAPE